MGRQGRIGDAIDRAGLVHPEDGTIIQKTRGGYTLIERQGGRPLARLRPFPDPDRVELFHWSFASDRWKTFGPFGSIRLELDDAVDIVQHDPMFRIERRGFLASLLG